jgi:hypothetical protein
MVSKRKIPAPPEIPMIKVSGVTDKHIISHSSGQKLWKHVGIIYTGN